MKKLLNQLIKVLPVKWCLVAVLATSLVMSSGTSVLAVAATGCRYEGQCLDNQKCHQLYSGGGANSWVFNGPCGSAIIGRVRPPAGVSDYNLESNLTGGGDIGILIFVSNVIKIFTAVGGLFVFVNFIIAGFTYITQAGNAQAGTDIKSRLTFSLIGLTIMVAAYTMIAVFSLIIFGNPLFIINPDLNSLGALAP